MPRDSLDAEENVTTRGRSRTHVSLCSLQIHLPPTLQLQLRSCRHDRVVRRPFRYLNIVDGWKMAGLGALIAVHVATACARVKALTRDGAKLFSRIRFPRLSESLALQPQSQSLQRSQIHVPARPNFIVKGKESIKVKFATCDRISRDRRLTFAQRNEYLTTSR
jgi:hypothetical protein